MREGGAICQKWQFAASERTWKQFLMDVYPSISVVAMKEQKGGWGGVSWVCREEVTHCDFL